MSDIRLTERDLRLLAKCAVCRWLTTGQLQRLYFPKATLNAVQKRLRKLSDEGYLRSYREHPTAEAIHAVGPKGQPLVEEKGLEAAAGGEPPRHWEHLMGINEMRIAVEAGPAPAIFYFAAWELARSGWGYPVIPDAVFAFRRPGRRAFLLEYDRGTEPQEELLGKLKRYAAGLDGLPFEAVVIVTEETRRLDLLGRGMRRSGVRVTALAATLGEIQAAGLYQAAFTALPRGGKRQFLLDTAADQGGEGLLSDSPFERRGGDG